MPYLPDSNHAWQDQAWQALAQKDHGYISLYARGRDYHKVVRQRLQKLGEYMQQHIAQHMPTHAHMVFRAWSDSAPVMEAAIAERAGLGWRGKHTLQLTRDAGSMFFLGELFTNVEDLALPDQPVSSHCGQCQACIDICPTQAIIGPKQIDARRCISYLTIEHQGSIPLNLRHLMGNRIYGCDDCQLICPWNKYAQTTPVPDFSPRQPLQANRLVYYLAWSEDDFLHHTQGTAIRRIGHIRWLRNLAVATGNALRTLHAAKNKDTIDALCQALHRWQTHENEIVREHVLWALAQQNTKLSD